MKPSCHSSGGAVNQCASLGAGTTEGIQVWTAIIPPEEPQLHSNVAFAWPRSRIHDAWLIAKPGGCSMTGMALLQQC